MFEQEFPCLQEEISSFCLLDVAKSVPENIKYFFHMHKLHRLGAELQGVARFSIFDVISKGVLASFNFQICLLSSVLSLLLGLLKKP